MTSDGSAARRRDWPLFRSFAGWRARDLGADAVAGLTLAAIAIPEQMATARLAGFEAQIGFLALFAGAIGFAAFGASRLLVNVWRRLYERYCLSETRTSTGWSSP